MPPIRTIRADPARMLTVTYEKPEGTEHVVMVILCDYAITAQGGRRVVAMRIVFDPEMPKPQEPYDCPRDRLQTLLLAPARVKLIAPLPGACGQSVNLRPGNGGDSDEK